MAISSLLSLTVRKNTNYDPEAMTINQVYSGAVSSDISKEDLRDSISLNGRVMDIMGTLTDEQIEAVFKVGYNNAVNQMIDIITTCSDITDKELINLFLGKANATGVPQRLRIVRRTPAPSNPTDPSNPAGPSNPDNPDNPIDPDNPTDPDSGDGTNGDGPTDPKNSTKDLYRGDPVWSTTITSTETVLTLKNPFTGSNYQYTITSLSGSQSAKFEFLANGRLVITGDNIKVVSSDNQQDDIILIGNNNELDTGDADDIVRVAYCFDSKANSMQGTSSNFDFSTTNEFGTTYHKLSTGNKINSGSGNDYVVMAGRNYTIDTGANNDKVKLMFSPNTNISGAEDVRGYDTQKAETLDGKDGWACQATIPDCRFFALINSIGGYGNLNNGNTSSWANIQDNGSSYRVTFSNYPATSGKKNYIDVSKSSIESYTGVYGDLDTIIISKALNDLIAINKDRSKTINTSSGSYTADDSVEHAYYNTIAKYVTGSENITYLLPNGWSRGGTRLSCEEVYGADYQTCFTELWNKYKSGEISNLTLGISSSNDKLGIISGHAYSVKEYNPSAGYIVITNPWDDSDCLRLSLTDFYALDTEVMVYGYDLYNMGLLVPNGGSIEFLSPNAVNSNLGVTIDYYGSNFDEIVYNPVNNENINPFANLSENNEPEIYDEIAEITSSIENVKEILEEKKTLELYS